MISPAAKTIFPLSGRARMGFAVIFAWCCLLFVSAMPAQAQEAARQLFLEGYVQRTEGEKAEKMGDFKRALECYRKAAGIYDQIIRDFPDFKPALVAFRRKALGEQITAVAERAAKMEIHQIPDDLSLFFRRTQTQPPLGLPSATARATRPPDFRLD